MPPIRSVGPAARGPSTRALRWQGAFLPIGLSALQAAAKAFVGFWTGSLAVLASALDSLLDCGISTINLLSLRKAEQPPDAEHSFGHGKAESLALLFEGTVIAGSAIVLAVQGVRHLRQPLHLQGYGVAALVMAASLATSLFLSWKLVRRAKETGSLVFRADSLHYASDVWTSGGVLAAIALQSQTGLTWIDPAFSIGVAAWIIWQVRPIFAAAVDELMDRELAEEERAQIEHILQTHSPQILGYHRLRTRRAGPQKTVDVHVVICKERPFEEAHALVNSLERAIRAQVPGSDVLVHADPCSSAPLTCPGPHRQVASTSGVQGPETYYESVEELPYALRQALNLADQEIYLQAFNEEYEVSQNPERAATAARRRLAELRKEAREA
jgi:ferrous-iron efflux pump FieF